MKKLLRLFELYKIKKHFRQNVRYENNENSGLCYSCIWPFSKYYSDQEIKDIFDKEVERLGAFNG